MRTLKGNETIFRTYLGDEDLEKLGIKKEPEDAKA
jgi:hypothetical protein